MLTNVSSDYFMRILNPVCEEICWSPVETFPSRCAWLELCPPAIGILLARFSMARNSQRRRSLNNFRAKHLSWLSPALLVDWAIAAGLVLISIRIERSYPYERSAEHYLGDNDLAWPHTWHERVPGEMLDNLTFFLPALVCALVAAVRMSLHELHHSFLVLYASRAVMRITVEWIKNRVSFLSAMMTQSRRSDESRVIGRTTQARLLRSLCFRFGRESLHRATGARQGRTKKFPFRWVKWGVMQALL